MVRRRRPGVRTGARYGLATRSKISASHGRIWKLVAFNVGIELGQLGAILVMVVVAQIVATRIRTTDKRRLAAQLTSGVLFATGSSAAAVLLFWALENPETGDRAELAEGTSCAIGR